jgi:hypothetical protein
MSCISHHQRRKDGCLRPHRHHLCRLPKERDGVALRQMGTAHRAPFHRRKLRRSKWKWRTSHSHSRRQQLEATHSNGHPRCRQNPRLTPLRLHSCRRLHLLRHYRQSCRHCRLARHRLRHRCHKHRLRYRTMTYSHTSTWHASRVNCYQYGRTPRIARKFHNHS